MKSELKSLRALMKKEGVDFYVQFNTDPHQSEYIGEHHRGVKYLSGFTGSNATLVISDKEAGIWTDGRYFIQCENEIEGSGFILFKENTKGYPTIYEYIEKKAKKGAVVGVNGMEVPKSSYDKFCNALKKSNGTVKDIDLLSEIWTDRPDMKNSKAFVLGEEYSGRSVKSKISGILKEIAKKDCNAILLNNLCDIAWTLNLRADDIPYVPVFYSFLYIDKNKVILFTGKDTLDESCKAYLFEECGDKLQVKGLNEVVSTLKSIKKKKVLLDPDLISITFAETLEKNNELVFFEAPIELMRAKKNKTEIKNSLVSHVNDGVALTKMIYFLKEYSKDFDHMPIKELDVAEDLSNLRAEISDYISDSFDTIAAYGPNAAMMHYAPAKGNNAEIKREGFLLIDSGGHYLTGTTDVTRTIAMGPLTDEEKYNYTRTLKGHLALMDAKFQKGATGVALDVLARGPFWETADDYLCGTGHGVGYLLSVHEGPNSIRWRSIKKEPAPIVPGMITTDEPGFYVEGKYGIRIENELLCMPYHETEYGEFYCFKPLTFVPYEMDAVLISELTAKEKKILNNYHSLVYKKVSPGLNEDEKAWLKKVTKPVK